MAEVLTTSDLERLCETSSSRKPVHFYLNGSGATPLAVFEWYVDINGSICFSVEENREGQR